MASLWIKICGLTTREAIEAAASSGADAVGFVFHPGSPRHLPVEQARALRRRVPAGIERVAVFLAPAQAAVDAVLGAIEPDWVQADADSLARLHLPAGTRRLPVLRGRPPGGTPLPSRCLFEGALSGEGKPADWTIAAELARATGLVLAGGLVPDNVAEAIRRVRPCGVDVSSGVESSRGVKDAAKIEEFIRTAREAERTLLAEESR